MTRSFESIKQREQSLMMQTYGRYPLAVSRAEGCSLFDLDGNEYLDLLSGIAVCSLGHSRPELAEVMAEQARKMVHVSNLFYQNEQLDLAEKLLDTCAADRVFLCNSGAEANEGAIKLARRYMRKVRHTEAFEVVTLEKSFHGRTLSTLTATGQEGPIKDGFDPLPPGFITVPFADMGALKSAISDKTAAVMIEMVQGEGGVRPLPEEYVEELKKLRDERGFLIIVDEVQTGLCRTGQFWAHQHYDLVPDIFTSAKALANGLPMGAVLATEEIAKGFAPGSHATTFGGGAVLSAVAAKVVDIMNEDRLADRAAELELWFKDQAAALAERHPEKVTGARGKGLLLGIELTFDGKDVWKALLDRRIVCNLTQGTILRLVPPLTIGKEQLARFFIELEDILTKA
ncbi:aspartate aminotransferase family protein [Salidesulfovibrio brasiliensis]|uniref:aspartate aminotransferase family protein n=1 Tax=Salidesulfovibrio brasiliensis TaxID=221711 RepID=UPI0006D1706F|nr:aspartate aminotransferase family protein [Salidesulfovibrio brasiliensis]